jgi:hypothetical protein
LLYVAFLNCFKVFWHLIELICRKPLLFCLKYLYTFYFAVKFQKWWSRSQTYCFRYKSLPRMIYRKKWPTLVQWISVVFFSLSNTRSSFILQLSMALIAIWHWSIRIESKEWLKMKSIAEPQNGQFLLECCNLYKVVASFLSKLIYSIGWLFVCWITFYSDSRNDARIHPL